MATGPLELVVLSFPTDRLHDGIKATLCQLSAAREMRIVDVLVIRADQAGRPRVVEVGELPGLGGHARWASGLIAAVDVAEMAALVGNGVDALAVLLEHRWVLDLEQPVTASSGNIVALTHLPGVPAVAAY